MEQSDELLSVSDDSYDDLPSESSESEHDNELREEVNKFITEQTEKLNESLRKNKIVEEIMKNKGIPEFKVICPLLGLLLNSTKKFNESEDDLSDILESDDDDELNEINELEPLIE